MKYTLALAAVLAAMAVVCDSSVLKASSRSSMDVGFVATGDRLLYSSRVYRPAVPDTNQYEDVIWRGDADTRISKVQATEVGNPQADAWITAGGLDRSNVTIRFQAWRGRGYDYNLEIWGR